MKVENGKKVSVDYTLTVDGQIADQSMPGQPLEFICGLGMLLPPKTQPFLIIVCCTSFTLLYKSISYFCKPFGSLIYFFILDID